MSHPLRQLLAIAIFSSFAASAAAQSAADGADGRPAGTKPGPVATLPAAAAPSNPTRTDTGETPNSTGPTPQDQVIADDLITQGSICAGLDCVNNESFGFDTIRLKENNTRIKFDDTSASAGFPNTDWQLTANDSASGGRNMFAIDDITDSKTPFLVMGNAPTNSLFIDATGRIGLRTGTPVLDLQITTSNTPGIRLEQNNTGGFTAQTWDVAGNEANFFVRDVTGGSRLPFRIRPGAPTSSVDISASGNVGIGTASPAATLDVNGDMLVHGTISQLSSRTAKENFQAIDGKMVLAKLEALPISTWNYRGDTPQDIHLGPVAEDFHAAFGLGASDHFVAPTDVAGVALASIKALQEEVRERDARVQALEARLAELEDLVRHGQR
jgi:hypothetical protein